MISLKSLKESAMNFPEPLRSIIEIARDPMSEQEFIDFFINLRKKAREMDAKQKEVQK